MSDKPVRLLVAAQNELRQITAWYRDEAGEALALRWTDAVSSSLRQSGPILEPAHRDMRWA